MRIWKSIFLLVVVALLILPLPGFTVAQDEDTLLLADYGPYGIGRMEISFVDESRDGTEVRTEIWYPARSNFSISWLIPS